MRELLEAGTVKSVIDRRYELREVPEALGHLGTTHARGKVLIVI
jgi:NADPH:quinone reductase-like Zn-dependent oxidoreductase